LNSDVMREKPRDTEDIFSRRLIVALLLFSISLSVVLYVGYFAALNGIIPVFDANKLGFIPVFGSHIPSSPLGWEHAKARTLLYTILVVSECSLVVALRRINKPVWRVLRDDRYWVAWFFIIAVPVYFLAFMYVPQIQQFSAANFGISLDLIHLTPVDWAIAVCLGLIPIVLLESYKLWQRNRGLSF
jgi:magnesium-transporting ATPase (P-type)